MNIELEPHKTDEGEDIFKNSIIDDVSKVSLLYKPQLNLLQLLKEILVDNLPEGTHLTVCIDSTTNYCV